MKIRNGQIVLINIACIIALIVVVSPLLMLARYNYPSADDWSFGINGYKILQNGGNLFDVLKVTFETVCKSYVAWEGRFIAVFFAALQPGIWGEQYYGFVTWIMLGAIVYAECLLFKMVLGYREKKNKDGLWIPIIIPSVIMQILYCPSPVESLYWYTGSVNYTFVFALSLVLLVLFLKIAIKEYSMWEKVLLAICSCLLAMLVGGNNFATSLSTFLMLCILSVFFALYNKKALKRTWFITLFTGGSLLLCIFAPGNMARIEGNFGGETGGAIEAICMSLIRSATNIYSWTNVKVIMMLAFVFPFIWRAVKQIQYKFYFPGFFTLVTFGIYASQCTATMYVDGTTGGGRMAAILFYTYHVWLLGNVIYWLGWLSQRENKLKILLDRIQDKCGKYLLAYCAVIGVLLVGLIYTTDLKSITSYRAYRNWRQGWAQQYAAEWEERLEVLHDDSVKDVVFEPISVYPEMILYTDLQDENGYTWVNQACAEYYDKNSIVVKPAQ